MIDALEGAAVTSTAKRPADHQITLSELAEHVSVSTYDYARTKYKGAIQAPERKGEFRLSILLIEVKDEKVAFAGTKAGAGNGRQGIGSMCCRMRRKGGYACRAGRKTEFSFGESESNFGDYGWFDKNGWNVGEKYAHRVGLKKPNA